MKLSIQQVLPSSIGARNPECTDLLTKNVPPLPRASPFIYLFLSHTYNWMFGRYSSALARATLVAALVLAGTTMMTVGSSMAVKRGTALAVPCPTMI
jgi:hypothetical protein